MNGDTIAISIIAAIVIIFLILWIKLGLLQAVITYAMIYIGAWIIFRLMLL